MKIYFDYKVVDISKQITPVDEEIRICNNILKRVEKIKKCELHQKLRQEKQDLENKPKEMKHRIR